MKSKQDGTCSMHVYITCGVAVVFRVALQKIDMTFVTRVSHVTIVRIYGSCSAIIFNPLSIPRYLEELFNFWAVYTLYIFNNQIIIGQPRICTEWESRCSLRICRCGKPNNFANKISGLFVFYFWFSPDLIKVISKFVKENQIAWSVTFSVWKYFGTSLHLVFKSTMNNHA